MEQSLSMQQRASFWPHILAAEDGFKRIEGVPVVLASRAVGHNPATLLEEGTAWRSRRSESLLAEVATQGGSGEKKMCVGEPCGLAADLKWTVEGKNIK